MIFCFVDNRDDADDDDNGREKRGQVPCHLQGTTEKEYVPKKKDLTYLLSSCSAVPR